MPKTSVKEINQRTSYRRRELRYSTKVKCDDFGLWLIQIGIFVLYVKLVVRTTYAQAQTLRGYTFMWSSRWGEGWSGKKLSKFRWKWMVTGVGEGIHKNWMSTRVQTVFQTSVWSPKFWRPGAGSLAQFEPIRTDGQRGKGGGGVQKLDIFHDYHKCMVPYKTQRQPSRGVFRKRFSENVQQIYKRTPMPKCDFKRVAKQLYWNHTSAWVFSCNFAACFQNTFS